MSKELLEIAKLLYIRHLRVFHEKVCVVVSWSERKGICLITPVSHQRTFREDLCVRIFLWHFIMKRRNFFVKSSRFEFS
jgi:hypothetical protein